MPLPNRLGIWLGINEGFGKGGTRYSKKRQTEQQPGLLSNNLYTHTKACDCNFGMFEIWHGGRAGHRMEGLTLACTFCLVMENVGLHPGLDWTGNKNKKCLKRW